MLPLKVYYKFPPFLKNIAASIYGLKQRVNKFGIIKNNEFIAQLRASQWFSKKVINLNQNEDIKRMLMHSKYTVPYYKEYLNVVDDLEIKNNPRSVLESMPILEKSTVRDNANSFLSEKFIDNNLYIEETSGSTGTPLKIFCDKSAYSFNHALGLTRWKEWAKIHKNDKKVMFGGKPIVSIDQKLPPFWIKNYPENQLYCSIYHMSDDNLKFYDHAIRDFNPKYIMEYPSAIYLYANYLYKRKMKFNGLKAVLTGSENLSLEKRKIMEDVFECDVYDGYSLAEYVTYITQCEHNTYHISPEAGIVEIFDQNNKIFTDNSIGNIITTTLYNYAMPLLRYNTGDLGSLSNDKINCKCTRELPILKTLDGRIISFLLLPNGSLVGSAGLSTAFHCENLLESQIIQKSRNEILLKLIVNENFSDLDLNNLLNGLSKRTDSLKINHKFVNSIDVGSNGKRHWIINEYVRDK